MHGMAALLFIVLGLAACRTQSTSNAPKPLEELRSPSMHTIDVTFRGLDEIRVAAYRYNHLRFELGQDLQPDPPRNLVGIWCTDEELPGFIEKMRKDNLFLKVGTVN